MAAASTDPLKDLQLLIRSRYGLIHLDTSELDRAGALLRHLADSLNLPYFLWTRTKGLKREDARAPKPQPGELDDKVYGSTAPAVALAHVEASGLPAVYHFQELGDCLDDKNTAARLADAAKSLDSGAGAIVMTGPVPALPETLRPRTAVVKLAPPDEAEFRALLQAIYRDVSARMPVQVKLTNQECDRLLSGLKGLTLLEAQKLLTRAMVEDGVLDARDLDAVLEAKRAIVEREGLLEYTPASERLEDIADLAGLKAWLAKRRHILEDPKQAAAMGLPFPRGVLLVGVQGCGKSLCAKAVAAGWGMPLLKLDPSNLYNKYVGESEKNFQRAMRTAERVAPVVLWIDEVEKAFSQGGSDEDGGVSQRVLGTFLSWLQDRKGDVFVVATANDIQRLPPELVRKGRFDEIFFVDLPDAEARLAILRTNLARHGQSGSLAEAAVVEATAGFSGAEVEQVVVSALYTAFSAKSPLTARHLLDEAKLTNPLSRTMKERIDSLREWAGSRCVPAN